MAKIFKNLQQFLDDSVLMYFIVIGQNLSISVEGFKIVSPDCG